jgi:hypothetical protein
MATACGSSKPLPPLVVQVGAAPSGECTVSLDGGAVNADAFNQAMAEMKPREVQLVGQSTTLPYRCIAGVIYSLQQAKMSLRMGFISEPPSVAESAPKSQR